METTANKAQSTRKRSKVNHTSLIQHFMCTKYIFSSFFFTGNSIKAMILYNDMVGKIDDFLIYYENLN